MELKITQFVTMGALPMDFGHCDGKQRHHANHPFYCWFIQKSNTHQHHAYFLKTFAFKQTPQCTFKQHKDWESNFINTLQQVKICFFLIIC